MGNSQSNNWSQEYISNLKNKINQLKAENKELKLALNSIGDAVIATDTGGHIIRMNQVAENLTGWTFDEASGKLIDNILKTIDPGTKNKVINPITRILQNPKTGKISDTDILVAKNDKKCFISGYSSLIKNNEDSIIGAIFVFRNITNKLQEKKNLRLKDSTIEAALNAIATADLEGKITYVNPAFLQMFGYNSKNKVYGKSVLDFGQNEEDLLDIIEVLKSKGSWDGELTLRKKNGSLIDVKINARIVKDNNGDPFHMLASVENITDHKKTEESLRKSEAKYRAVFENTGAATFIIENNTTISLANKKFEELTGYKREEIEGKMSWTEFVDPGDLPKMLRYHKNRREENYQVPNRYEFSLTDKNGEVHNILAMVGIIPGTDQSIASLLDITERKQIEEKFKHIWEKAEDGFRLTDKNGIITRVNQAFCNMVELDKTELEGQPLSVIYDNNHDEVVQRHKQRFQEKSILNRIEDQFLLHNGKTRWFEVVNSYVNTPGEPSQILAIFRDVTDRKKSEQEKKNLHKQLLQAQKLESIGNLAGGVAHDFNNILTVIIGLSQIVMRNLDEDDRNYKHLENIYESGERAAKLTNQLLLFSRKQEMTLHSVDLNKIITRIDKMLKRLIGEDISIETTLAEDLWIIKADEGQIEQIITNLAINARDAMPNGGNLAIATRNITIDRQTAKTIHNIKDGKYVCLSIADTGTGIDKNIREKIFDPFFTTKKAGEGTGMGLSVVHGIIRKHQGVIKVDSEPGEGTVFKIYLPANQKNQQNRAHKSKQHNFTKFNSNGETVLLVEDEKPVLTYLENIFDKYKFNYLSASSGEEALEIFQQNRDEIDLLLSDVIMTGIDGVSLANKLKNKKQDLKVILSSGYSDKKVSPGEINEKGYKFIQKPYNLNELLKMIRNILN